MDAKLKIQVKKNQIFHEADQDLSPDLVPMKRAKSRSHGTIANISKFVNKAAAQRQITVKKNQKQKSGMMEQEGSIHESWGGLSNLEKSHDTENSKGSSQKSDATRDKSEGSERANGSKGVEKFHFEIEDMDQEKRIPAHMISPNSPGKLLWNLLIMILAVYTAIILPIRLAFMDENNISKPMFFFDIFTDIAFLVDISLQFFFVEEDEDGDLILDQRIIAITYLKSWFVVDLLSSIPVSIIAIFMSSESESMQGVFISIRFLKLTKFARIYRLLSLFKMMKMFRNNKFMEITLTYLNISPDMKQIFSSLIRMVFLLHIVGCTFAIVALLSGQEKGISWISSLGISDESVETRYIAACYYSITTISTVGYGDITPTNETEVIMTIGLIFFGVSMYSYIISRLTSIFAIVNNSNSEEQSREKLLKNFINKQRLDMSLSAKVIHFFQRSETNIIHMTKEYKIDQLLNILPSYLKAEVTYYLFKQAIDVVKVFQDKEQRFYGEYLSKFRPLRLSAKTCFVEEGSLPQAVYFLLQGSVMKDSELNRLVGAQSAYLVEGSIFGETDLLKNRMRSESYIAVTECYLLMIDKALFKEIMEEFDDFRAEVTAISQQREWMRMARIQAFKLGVDEQTYLGQHAIDKENTHLMEERLEREKEPKLTDEQTNVKLRVEREARWLQIEVFFTLRESTYLGIDQAILANSHAVISRAASISKKQKSQVNTEVVPPSPPASLTPPAPVENVVYLQPRKLSVSRTLNVEEIQKKVRYQEQLVKSYRSANSSRSKAASSRSRQNSSRNMYSARNLLLRNSIEKFEGGEAENRDQQLLQFADDGQQEVTLESIHNLGERVRQCATHLQYGKLLIHNYRKVFQAEIDAMKQGDQIENELYIRNYKQGIGLLTAYIAVMLNIEKHLATIDLQSLLKEILSSEADTVAIKQRYYLLETKLNEIMGALAKKVTSLNQEKSALLTNTSLQMIMQSSEQ